MAAGALTFQVLDARRLPAIDDKRAGKFDRSLLVKLDDGRVHMLRVPDEGFTESVLVAAVRAELASEASLKGKTYTL